MSVQYRILATDRVSKKGLTPLRDDDRFTVVMVNDSSSPEFAAELSKAVRLDTPIRLADVASHQADAVMDLDGDVRGVSLADKKRVLQTYNEVMLDASPAVVDTQASYRDEVSEYWFVNSEGTVLYELRPEIVISGVAIARLRTRPWGSARSTGSSGTIPSVARKYRVQASNIPSASEHAI